MFDDWIILYFAKVVKTNLRFFTKFSRVYKVNMHTSTLVW